jgi:hypothetical protein
MRPWPRCTGNSGWKPTPTHPKSYPSDPRGSPEHDPTATPPLDTITAKAKLLSRLLGAHQALFDGLSATAGGYPFIEYGPDGLSSSRHAAAVERADDEVEASLDRLIDEIGL